MVGVVNVGLIIGLGITYRWWFRDDEESVRRFKQRYGTPTEQQRLDVFTWLAPKWDSTVGVYEKSSAERHRRELLAKASGDILELGVGTAPTLEIYKTAPEGVIRSFVGIDKVEGMVDLARAKLENLPFKAEVLHGDAEHVPFPDESFDTVVGALCICSVEHPEAVLKEMARVCRKTGQVLLLEPGLANTWPIRFGQGYLGLCPNPKHAWEFGWHDDLQPVELVHASPLIVRDVKVRAMGNWYLIVATPE